MGSASYEKAPALLYATRLATSMSQGRFRQRLPEPRSRGFPSRGPAVILSAAPDWVAGGVVTKGSLIKSRKIAIIGVQHFSKLFSAIKWFLTSCSDDSSIRLALGTPAALHPGVHDLHFVFVPQDPARARRI